MKDFLTDYVNMILDVKDLDINDSQFDNIIDSLCNDEELWDYVDSTIFETIAKETGNI